MAKLIPRLELARYRYFVRPTCPGIFPFMLLRLFLLFTLVPVIELGLLIEIGARIGVGLTVAIVLATGAAGAWLARTQGLRALQRLQRAVSSGQFPGDEIFDGILVLSGGLLLLTPGFLTDLIGFAAVLPGSRHVIKAGLKRQVGRRIRPNEVHGHYTAS
ncbi:MAG: FxsA family protein [Candidatus Latescibacterota bacterium]|nr:FxsA family protein [Candidatus Latescibacterota bacterium]